MKAITWFSKFLAIFSGLLILFSALLISYSAFARYLFHASSTWESELSIYLLMGSVWLGCGPTMLANRHVAIRILSKICKQRSARNLHRFAHFICIVVGLVLTVKGIQLTVEAIQGNWHASTIWAPSLVGPYLLIPIGLSFFVVAAVIRLFRPMSNTTSGDDMEA